jgi:hypothetical protein
MKIILACSVAFFLLIACDEFKEAPLSKCNSNPSTVLLVAEENPCPFRAFLVSRIDDTLVTDLQMQFVCSGIKYGYDAELDAADPTILAVHILTERSGDMASCVCCKRMTVTYKAAAEKIAQITQVKVFGDDWETPAPLPIEEE